MVTVMLEMFISVKVTPAVKMWRIYTVILLLLSDHYFVTPHWKNYFEELFSPCRWIFTWQCIHSCPLPYRVHASATLVTRHYWGICFKIKHASKCFFPVLWNILHESQTLLNFGTLVGSLRNGLKTSLTYIVVDNLLYTLAYKT